MILPVLTALVLVLAALAAGIETASSALRQGRDHFRQAVAVAAAEQGVAESALGGWAAAGASLPIGGGLALGTIPGPPGVVTTSDVRRLTAELWLVRSRSEVRSVGGAILAAEERGLVVRLVQVHAGSSFRVIAIRRPWVRRAT